jgi:uncharacterized membrane protein YkgB
LSDPVTNPKAADMTKPFNQTASLMMSVICVGVAIAVTLIAYHPNLILLIIGYCVLGASINALALLCTDPDMQRKKDGQ